MGKPPTLFETILADSQLQVQNALSHARGKKVLVVDIRVSGIISRIADATILKEHAIESIFYLTEEPILADCRTIVYICRPDPVSILNIIGHIQHDAKVLPPVERNYLAYCLPRGNLLCKHLFEERGVLANVELHDLLIEFLPLEKDLFSMEIESFNPLYLHKDVSPLFQLALGLISLESVVGPFACIRGKGENAQTLWNILEKKKNSNETSTSPSLKANTLILIDRSVDLVTPFLTQLTYAGLLDTFKGVQSGYIKLDSTAPHQKPKKFKLSKEEDGIFRELADLHFSALTACLQKHAKELKHKANERHQAETINDIYQFVEHLPEIQKKQEHLPIHLDLAEGLSQNMDETFYKYLETQKNLLKNSQVDWDFIQELISRHFPLNFVLSLICLASELGLLKEKQLETLRVDLIQTYGITCMTLWSHLCQLGLLYPSKKPNLYTILRKPWQLYTESPPSTDLSALYAGYVPISVRLVNYFLNNQMELLQKHTLGPTISSGTLSDTMYLVFIGGITLAEVSCLRALAKSVSGIKEWVIITTEILSPRKIFGTGIEASLK